MIIVKNGMEIESYRFESLLLISDSNNNRMKPFSFILDSNNNRMKKNENRRY